MKPKLLVFTLLILMAFFSAPIKAQCFNNVKFNVIQSQHAIELVFDADYDNVIVNLENVWLQGNKVFENSNNLGSVSVRKNYIVFKDLAPSKYLIQLVTEDCKWVIGGVEGIIIKDEDEK